jgi:O-methyltransferase
VTDPIRSLLRRLPEGIKAPLRRLEGTVARFSEAGRSRQRWLSRDYLQFAMEQRERIFIATSRFAHINRPICGYYFEFGCHGANTMRMAWKHTRHLHDWTFVGFDSFEGLPEIAAIDRQTIWRKGRLATSEEHFVRLVTSAGMPRERLKTVKGFYDESLTEELKARLLPAKAAMIYIDCDLYQSTVPVLRFIKDFLQPGTVIVFDDWYCFNGDPMLGEQRAWREFREANQELRFTEFVQTSEARAFIHLGPTPPSA